MHIEYLVWRYVQVRQQSFNSDIFWRQLFDFFSHFGIGGCLQENGESEGLRRVLQEAGRSDGIAVEI